MICFCEPRKKLPIKTKKIYVFCSHALLLDSIYYWMPGQYNVMGKLQMQSITAGQFVTIDHFTYCTVNSDAGGDTVLSELRTVSGLYMSDFHNTTL